LEPRTPTGSIFAAWQPLRMPRRSWATVTDFNTRVLTLKPEKSFRHTKVEIPRLKSCFPRRRETKLNANLWKTFSTELFRRRSWWFHVVLPNDLYLSRKPRPRSSSARPAMLFVNQERLVLKFPIVLVGQTQDGMVYQLNDVVLYCWTLLHIDENCLSDQKKVRSFFMSFYCSLLIVFPCVIHNFSDALLCLWWRDSLRTIFLLLASEELCQARHMPLYI